MHGPEIIHMGQHGTNALGFRLKARKTQQRVEPDQPRAGLPEPFGGLRQPRRTFAVQPISDQQHHRPLAQNAPRPKLVEQAKAFANPRAARPIGDDVGHHLEREFRITMTQLPRHIGQARAEQEAMHPVAVIGHSMEEMQQDLRITRHAAADIA